MRALIFDLDGTLLNTLEDIASATNAALRMHGYPTHPVSNYRYMVGNGFPTLVARALPQDIAATLGQETLRAIVADARAYYGEHICDYTTPYPGIEEMLSTLAAQGKILCVLSNKIDDLTRGLIAHCFPHIPFAQVVGNRDGVPLKPDPTPLNAMLAELALAPEDCLFVGDSKVDIATAHAVGMRVAAVTWGFSTVQELEGSDADHIVAQASELLDLAGATN